MFWLNKNKKKSGIDEIINNTDKFRKEVEKDSEYISEQAYRIIEKLRGYTAHYEDKAIIQFLTNNDELKVELHYVFEYSRGHMCTIYFNDVLVVPRFRLFEYYYETPKIKWIEWVVDSNKQRVYNNILLELQTLLDEIETEKRLKKEKEIREKIEKIGL